MKIVVDNGTPEGENLKDEHDSKVSVVNTIGHSLWETINVMLNNVLISDGSRDYPYKSYVQQVYSYNDAVKRRNLNCEYFYPDDVTMVENVNVECEGFKQRGSSISRSKEIIISIIPYVDILNTTSFLPAKHKLSFEFQ